jgi:hypothetical protein
MWAVFDSTHTNYAHCNVDISRRFEDQPYTKFYLIIEHHKYLLVCTEDHQTWNEGILDSILDPALITNVTGYEPYEKGLEQDVFIKWPNNTSPDYDEYNKFLLLLSSLWLLLKCSNYYIHTYRVGIQEPNMAANMVYQSNLYIVELRSLVLVQKINKSLKFHQCGIPL